MPVESRLSKKEFFFLSFCAENIISLQLISSKEVKCKCYAYLCASVRACVRACVHMGIS